MRGAWCRAGLLDVALRKESVDRNKRKIERVVTNYTSLSARRAWIEIVIVQLIQSRSARRSPQGERG